MEVPTTTKVKVTDFFQRLVCGLLIFFHLQCFLHAGWFYSSSNMTWLWICFVDLLSVLVFFNTQSLFFVTSEYNQPKVSLLEALAHLTSSQSNGLSSFQSLLDFHPKWQVQTNTNHGQRCSDPGLVIIVVAGRGQWHPLSLDSSVRLLVISFI